jgi:hypothetical protein
MEMAAYRSSRDEGTTWIVVDFVEVVVHLFEPEQRLYYDLELMWSQAKRVDWRRGAVESDAATTKSAGSDDEQTKPAAVSKKAPAKKAPANAAKAPAKKSTTKKSTTKKSTAKKSTTNKTSTRRARSDD